jgi:UDP-glucose 6-dehydrogenase
MSEKKTVTPREFVVIAEATIKTATEDLRRSGAAFAADALHHRMTGATVVLLDDAAEELARMLHQHADLHEYMLTMVKQLAAFCEKLGSGAE